MFFIINYFEFNYIILWYYGVLKLQLIELIIEQLKLTRIIKL